ncbi:MAG TPA: class E sortase [Acidimicrobiales bacterium]|nr:class E sortase [Acidimicrobiales bacterium]
MRLARVLGAIGRTCITAGVLILLFVAYQLWGTGIRESQAQARLEDDFEEILADARDRTPTTTSTTAPGEGAATTEPETVEPSEPVPEGEPTARIVIPAIGVDKIVVEGVSLADLKKGPGHFPETPLPGQAGNAAIAGHRTTYGAPFHRLDELEAGDEITVETVQGEFRYLVSEQLIVSPTEVHVLEDKGDDRLTLIACHPKYSARQRIVVVAHLAPELEALPRPPRAIDDPVPAPTAFEDLDGEGASTVPTILLGLLCAAIWFAAWLLGRAWRRWPAYALGLPFFLVALFYFFEEFSRFLPSSF